MSGPELKPCPFCGVRPHIHDDASHSTAFFADCYNDNCTVQPSAYGLSKAEAIAAWNTRASVDYAALPEVQAMIAAAETRALDSVTTLHTVIAHIRAATVGDRPMLSELAAALMAWRDEAVKAEREACLAIISEYAENEILKPASGWPDEEVRAWNNGGLDHLLAAAAAIRKRGEGQP